MKNSFWARLIGAVFPARCGGCGQTSEGNANFCEGCAEKIKRQRNTDKPVISIAKQCFEDCVAPFYYEEPISDLICKFKFRGKHSLAGALADLLTFGIKDLWADADFDLFTFVPGKESGIEHMQILAREVSKQIKLPVISVLAKVKNNKKQHNLGLCERLVNVQGVYAVKNHCNIKEKRILLIDDVVTTGSTLNECAKVLKEAGASLVCCATISTTKASHLQNFKRRGV